MSGFWTSTEAGHTVHINGNPNMDEATRLALTRMADAYIKQRLEENAVFEQVWGAGSNAGSNNGIDKDKAKVWFMLGIDYQESVSNKRITYLERRLREEIELGKQQAAELAQMKVELQHALLKGDPR